MPLYFRDVVDEAGFALVPPCADGGYDHRTCDYWEDADRGSKAARASWLERTPQAAQGRRPGPANPFATDQTRTAFNPFAPPTHSEDVANPFSAAADAPTDNPFAPRREARPGVASGAPRKLELLGRGAAVFGSYAKLAIDGDAVVAYAQFGPLSAYPRALRVRELYTQLPQSPLPAVITCIATTAVARRQGCARALVAEVCRDLADRGFAAVEAYPTAGAEPDATSAASIGFWLACGFSIAVSDERYPVVRRELG
jgi:GNAT superfamily N-acetyltransferase